MGTNERRHDVIQEQLEYLQSFVKRFEKIPLFIIDLSHHVSVMDDFKKRHKRASY